MGGCRGNTQDDVGQIDQTTLVTDGDFKDFNKTSDPLRLCSSKTQGFGGIARLLLQQVWL